MESIALAPVPPHWILYLADTWFAHLVADSAWLFALIQAFHLIGLAVFGGALLIVDLSVLGVGFALPDIPVLRARTLPWLVGSLTVLTVSGVLMAWSEAEKCYTNPAFIFKMICFGLAVAFLTTLRRGVMNKLNPGDREIPVSLKIVSVLSIGLWLSVGIGGRAIGFY